MIPQLARGALAAAFVVTLAGCGGSNGGAAAAGPVAQSAGSSASPTPSGPPVDDSTALCAFGSHFFQHTANVLDPIPLQMAQKVPGAYNDGKGSVRIASKLMTDFLSRYPNADPVLRTDIQAALGRYAAVDKALDANQNPSIESENATSGAINDLRKSQDDFIAACAARSPTPGPQSQAPSPSPSDTASSGSSGAASTS